MADSTDITGVLMHIGNIPTVVNHFHGLLTLTISDHPTLSHHWRVVDITGWWEIHRKPYVVITISGFLYIFPSNPGMLSVTTLQAPSHRTLASWWVSTTRGSPLAPGKPPLGQCGTTMKMGGHSFSSSNNPSENSIPGWQYCLTVMINHYLPSQPYQPWS